MNVVDFFKKKLGSTHTTRHLTFAAMIVTSTLFGATPVCAGIGSWAASPESPLDDLSQPGAPFASQSFNNQTVRQVVRISAGGATVQIRLSNELGTTPLIVGETHIANAGAGGAIVATTDRKVTFLGKTSVTIPAGKAAVSDPVPLSVADKATLAVSTWFPQNTGKVVWHPFGQALTYVTDGNTTASPNLPPATILTSRFVLTGVDVMPLKLASTVVAFGDSITDGFGSTIDANLRYPDQLANKFVSTIGSVSVVGVVNAGIGGNRLLSDYPAQAGVTRFQRDALGVSGVTKVIVLEGINDIGFSFLTSQPITADQLIAGYKQLISAAHSARVKIYGATLTPFGGAFYYSSTGESIRQAVNQWIRTSQAFDGVIDFDAALRDPTTPAQLQTQYDSGDHLHPNDTGYAALAAAAYSVLK